MDGLSEVYFDAAKKGKAYKHEEEYMGDLYAFLDLCIVAVGVLITQQADGEGQGQKRLHVRELPGSLENAYESVLRRAGEPAAQQRMYIRQQLSLARQHIKGRLLYTPYAGRDFKMRMLCRELRLSDFEQFLLLLGSATYYDIKYAQLFADLQGLESLDKPTSALAIFLYSLFAEAGGEEVSRLVQRQGTLIESFFDILKGIPGRPDTFCFTINRRTCSFFSGYQGLDKKVMVCASYASGAEPSREIYIRMEELGRIRQSMGHFLSDEDMEGQTGNVLHLYGPAGNGKKLFLREAAKQLGYGMIYVDVEKLARTSFEEVENCLASLVQESILLHACLCFVDSKNREETEADELQKTQPFPAALSYLIELLARKVRFFIWLSLEKSQYLLNYPLHLLCMEHPMLTIGERIVLWRKFASGYPVGDVDFVMCANQYILSVQGIQEVLRTADLLRRQSMAAAIEMGHIHLAVKQQSPNQLGRFATLIPAVYTWEDLVVSPEQEHQMRLICNQLKYRNVVGEEWGFFKKTAYGRGICALLYGSPGTGKTMAVQIMANELGLDLYRVDISQLVSKYIGETEKNISTLFKKAKNINALLFFDEADALFAKRSEVRDSHDRNANAETAHLLQKLEDYEGIAVLATNYVNNIDDAFKRRIKFMVNFSFPTPQVRLQLWNAILPKTVPCEEELDFEFYAENFELSGSSIKEILTNAAFIAAAGEEKLANRHVIEAIKINFSKYGKVLTDSDFGYLI